MFIGLTRHCCTLGNAMSEYHAFAVPNHGHLFHSCNHVFRSASAWRAYYPSILTYLPSSFNTQFSTPKPRMHQSTSTKVKDIWWCNYFSWLTRTNTTHKHTLTHTHAHSSTASQHHPLYWNPSNYAVCQCLVLPIYSSWNIRHVTKVSSGIPQSLHNNNVLEPRIWPRPLPFDDISLSKYH
jgi:hypothetical protein